MKTTTELFLAFTENRNPTITRGDSDVYANAKEFFISSKQSSWLCNLIFQKASKIKGGELNSSKQYIENINGKNYILITGKKTNRIRVY